MTRAVDWIRDRWETVVILGLGITVITLLIMAVTLADSEGEIEYRCGINPTTGRQECVITPVEREAE